MDENLTTAGEPTIVESTVTPTDTGTVTTNTDIADGSQVIETPTQMDNNVTYNNIDITNDVTDPTITNPTEPTNDIIIDPNKSLVDNVYDNIVTHEHDTNLTENSGSAMKNFFLKDYDYDVNEVGSYWVGGAMNDVKNQMSFLNVLINEEMYDALDLQKYYFDNNLATARAYAAKKDKETAYNYYRAAQEKAIAEGELTGWYMPAEGRYMLGQYTIAMNILENPDASQEERDKADRIKGTVEDWFGANKIGTQGIKTLGMMNYEETVRHNKVTERLQKQANAAAASAAGAQLAATLWDIAELELVWRTDLDNNGVIGHTNAERKATNSDLFQYLNEHDAWQGFYKFSETRDMAWTDGTARQMAKINNVNYAELERTYNTSKDLGIINEAMVGENAPGYIALDKLTGIKAELSGEIKTADGKTITASQLEPKYYKILSDVDGETKAYIYAELKNGGTIQITDENFEINGHTLKEMLYDEDFDLNTPLAKNELRTKDGKFIRVGENLVSETVGYDFKVGFNDGKPTFINIGSKEIYNTIDDLVTNGGYTWEASLVSSMGIDDEIVISKPDGDNGKKYYAVQNNGTIKEITDPEDLITVKFTNGKTRTYTYNSKPTLENRPNAGSKEIKDSGYTKLAEKKFMKTNGMTFKDSDEKTYDVVAYNNGDGTVAYGIIKKTANARAHSAGGSSHTSSTVVILSEDDLSKIEIQKGSSYNSRAEFEKQVSNYTNKKGTDKSIDTSNVLDNANKDVATIDVEKENKKGVKASGGGASAPKIIDSQQAKGSDEVTFTAHNTELSPDEIATQNVLAYNEDKEKERQKQNKERSINNIKEVS